MLTGGTQRTGMWNADGGTEQTGEWNVNWKNRADWTAECRLEEKSVLESGMLTGKPERNGERNV